MKTLLLTLSILAAGPALALEVTLVKQQTCKHATGYGTYIGQGKTIHLARSQATRACVMDQVERYEAQHGETPSADIADQYFDACVNICSSSS